MSGRLRDQTPRGRAMQMIRSARWRAERKGLEFNLTLDDIFPFPARCPVLGIKLDCTPNSPMPTSPSLDRIDPSQGYTPDNVRIVCDWFNRARGAVTDEEMVDCLRSAINSLEET